MFNNLAYIPMVLAYTFVALLLVILGFIVIYVAHKIYITVYDNLPVVQLSAKSFLTQQSQPMVTSSNTLHLGSKADVQAGRKSKTALRIIITLEPCYLAYVMFESKLPLGLARSSRPDQNSSNTTSSVTDSQVSMASEYCFIKYFDHLTSIPNSRDLQNGDNIIFKNLYTYRKSK